METQRQIKIAGVIQKEMAIIFNEIARESTLKGLLITATKVRVSSDMSVARVYLSIFPPDKAKDILQDINSQRSFIKHKLSSVLRYQMRKLPEINYFIDDSLDYIDNINMALTGNDDPVQNPELLSKRKKV